MKITPVILSGGGGTRLWPMSTPERPKQFLALTGDQTMFQLTLQRVQDRALFDAPLLVANAAHADLIDAQCAEIGVIDATALLEPCARNTAPAIALAALAATDPMAILLVMPSDHVIADVAAFHAATQAALPLVEAGWMVTYGIAPTAPETGYGYIKMGAALENGVRQVDRFVEKPDRANAEAMLAAGSHAWNGGIFLFRADIYLGALAVHAPDMLAAAQKAMADADRTGNRIAPDLEAFAACPADSIDYAVMEKADRVAVVPVDMGWSDVGSWDALYEIGAEDDSSIAINCTGNLVQSNRARIHMAGVENLIVVANGDDILIVPRGKSQDVKLIVEALKAK